MVRKVRPKTTYAIRIQRGITVVEGYLAEPFSKGAMERSERVWRQLNREKAKAVCEWRSERSIESARSREAIDLPKNDLASRCRDELGRSPGARGARGGKHYRRGFVATL